ncbi:MAG: PDZ domain-containing protein [Elusimicrobia bacterium]|nr:PDZ domain-containing protein [Elusimicrobiota bacterium]
MTSQRPILLSGLLTLAALASVQAAAPSGKDSQAQPAAAQPAADKPAAAKRHQKAADLPKPAAKAAKPKPKPAKRPTVKVPTPEERRETAAQARATTPSHQPMAGLSLLGALTAERPSGLEVLALVPGSEAESMGMTPGDHLTYLFASPSRTQAHAAERMKTLPAEGRLSAVVVRGLGTQPLSGKPQAFVPAVLRGPDELSTHEMLLKEKRLARAQADADAAVRNAEPQEFKIAAGQSLWIHFPKGIPSSAGPGDVLQGEATTAVCTDQSLDYLSLPPKTVFWAKVLDSHGPAQTNNLRLFFFKMRLPGGSFYPLAGRVVDISGGDGRLVKVTPGGTIVTPNDTGLDSDLKVKLELLQPVTLVEPPSFYSTGVGLWIKTREDGPGFKISHIIPGRSAAAAGLQPGDVIMSIDGAKASTFDFAGAVSALYGKQESGLKLGVVRLAELESAKPKAETIILKRGVTMTSAEGESVPLPPPYAEKRAQ